tara:strand:+ start:1068 stop:1604 length:537 start_codon:yes stop_codon:yes gene_type:complete
MATISSRRFAQAVFQIASENNSIDQWLGDLEVLASATTNPEFIQFVNSPRVESDKKIQVIKESFTNSISELAVNLACLLSARNSVGLLQNIADDFQSFVDLNKGVERADVTTAVELSELQKKDLADKLKEIVGKDISIETHIDESVIGGFVARVGDLLVDGSIKTKLSNMERELIKGA